MDKKGNDEMKFEYGDYECQGCGHIIDEDTDTILYKNSKGKTLTSISPNKKDSPFNFCGYICNACNTREILK